jgi:hypothetical protein
MVLFMVAFMLSLVFVVKVEISYSSSLPGAPDQSLGRIYRMTVNHGYIVYGTLREFKLLNLATDSFEIGMLLALIAGLLNVKYGDFPPCQRKGQSR